MSAQKKNPVENIRNLYEEDARSVPYPVFMKCFDALLADPPDPHPAPPSEDLKPSFRAVCMALDLGVADQQDRAEDRREEFYEHILPVWREELSDAEIESFCELLSGKVRERLEGMRREDQKREAEEHRQKLEEDSEEAVRHRKDRFSRAMKDALRETKQSPTSRPAQGPTVEGDWGEGEGDTSARIPLDQGNRIPSAEDVEEIQRAIEDGEIPIQYNTPKDRAPFAEYRYKKQLMEILLIEKKGNYFVLLEADHPTKNTSGAPEILRKIAEDMSYEQDQPCSYHREIGQASIKLQLGHNGTYLACRRPRKLNPEELAKTVGHLHKNFCRFLDALADRSSESPNE